MCMMEQIFYNFDGGINFCEDRFVAEARKDFVQCIIIKYLKYFILFRHTSGQLNCNEL